MAHRIKQSIRSSWQFFVSSPMADKLLLITVACLALPFYLVSVPLIVCVVYAVSSKKRIKQLISIKLWYLYLLFALYAIAVPLLMPQLPIVSCVQFYFLGKTVTIYGKILGILGGIISLPFAIFALFVRTRMTKDLMARILPMLCIISVIAFFVALGQRVYYWNLNDDFRATSTFSNANYYAYFAELCILIALFKISQNHYKIWLYLPVILINICAVFLCQTRSVFPAVFVGAVALFLFMKRYRLLYLIVGIGVVASIMFMIDPTLLPRFSDFGQHFYERKQIWHVAADGFSLSPYFGRGIWSYVQNIQYLKSIMPITLQTHVITAKNAHNILLEPMLSFGIVGTGLIAVLFVDIVWRIQSRRKNGGINGEGALVFSFICASIMHGITDLPMLGVQSMVIVLLLLGLAGSGQQQKQIATK